MGRLPRTLATLACLAALFGCRPPEAPPSARTIVLWEQEDASVFPFLDQVFSAFRKLPGNEDVRIVRTHYHTEDLRQQFLTASIAGSPPDLIMGPSDSAGVYSVAGFVLPVNDLFDLERFNKPVVEAISLDGKTWGIPLTNGNHLMLFHNKRLAPVAPQTTAEFFDYCAKKAPKLGLQYCLALNIAEPFWLVPWMGAYGGWPIDNKTPTLDTPATRKAIAFILDLIAKKYVPAECDYNCADALFKEEKTAFLINGDWAISAYQEKFGKDLGIARIPLLSETGQWPSPMISGKYLMLSSKLQGGKLELVRRLVEFFVNEENQVAQVKALQRLPSLTRAASSPVILESPVLRNSMSQIQVGKPMPMATEIRAVWDAMRPLLGRAIIGKMTPEEAAAQMQRDALSKIQEMND